MAESRWQYSKANADEHKEPRPRVAGALIGALVGVGIPLWIEGGQPTVGPILVGAVLGVLVGVWVPPVWAFATAYVTYGRYLILHRLDSIEGQLAAQPANDSVRRELQTRAGIMTPPAVRPRAAQWVHDAAGYYRQGVTLTGRFPDRMNHKSKSTDEAKAALEHWTNATAHDLESRGADRFMVQQFRSTPHSIGAFNPEQEILAHRLQVLGTIIENGQA
jgi:hypothetical protein